MGSALTENAFLTCAVILSGLLTGYILVDRFSSSREFRLSIQPVDLALLLWVAVLLAAELRSPLNVGEYVAWPLFAWLVCWSLELFPGLHRHVFSLMVVAPIGAFFILFQQFGEVSLAFPGLSAEWEESVTGLRSFGLFSNAASVTVTLAFQLALLASSLLNPPVKRSFWRTCLLALGFSGVWLALVSMESWAAMAVAAGAIGVVLMYFHRTLFGIFVILVTTVYLARPWDGSVSFTRFTTWLERGETVTEMKRVVAQSHVASFSAAPVVGEGLQHPHYTPVSSNLYLDLLRSVGSIGFVLFFVLMIALILKAHRLFGEIPQTHALHRVLLVSIVAGFAAFLVLGLFTSPMKNTFVLMWLAWLWGVLRYLDLRYSGGLVPDDHSI